MSYKYFSCLLQAKSCHVLWRRLSIAKKTIQVFAVRKKLIGSKGEMDPEEFYLSNWWLLLVILCILLLIGVGVFYVILRFPGIIDWKFIKQNFEDRVQDPVKKFSSSLYGHLMLAGGEVVRKISVRCRYATQIRF